MPITKKTLAGYPQWNVDAASGGATVVIKEYVAWSDMVTYANSLLPQITISGTGFVIVLGATWDGNPAYRVKNFTIRPSFDERSKSTSKSALFGYADIPDYDWAEFTITYEFPGYGQSSDQGDDPIPYLHHSWSSALEYIEIDKGSWVWDTGEPVGKKVPQGIIATRTTHRIEWPLILNPPWSILRATQGKVNNASFKFKSGTVPAEALLFLNADIEQRVLGDGTVAYKMIYYFEEAVGRYDAVTGQPAGWNHFWRDDKKSGWYRVWRTDNDGNLHRVYETADFDALFGL